jgi:hypothetical protein
MTSVNPGTAGNILTSDGTDWVSSAKPTYTYSEVGAAPSSTVSFPGFGTSHSTAAYGDHTHSYQAQLNGTGFVKASGTTISYDNSTYQPANTNLTAIAALTGEGMLWRDTNGTWSLPPYPLPDFGTAGNILIDTGSAWVSAALPVASATAAGIVTADLTQQTFKGPKEFANGIILTGNSGVYEKNISFYSSTETNTIRFIGETGECFMMSLNIASQPVSFGANDSSRTGYRLLEVPNSV